jgi:5'-nucleotidase
MRRIAIDMDDTLADTLATLLEWARDRFGVRLTRADLVGRELGDALGPERAAALEALLGEGSCFADPPLIPGAVEVVRELARQNELFVVSAAIPYPGSFIPKLRWMERHFPFIPASHVVFCGDKAIVDADFLVDDRVHKYPRFRGRGILFDAPHNAPVTGYPRARSWAEVARLLDAAG